MKNNPIRFKGTILIPWPFDIDENSMMLIENLEILDSIITGQSTNLIIVLPFYLGANSIVDQKYIDAKKEKIQGSSSYNNYLAKTSKILSRLINKSEHTEFYLNADRESFDFYKDIFKYGIQNMKIDFYDESKIKLSPVMKQKLAYYNF